jgi:LAS superfamily LD-carboxypeptidase LdcB
MDESHFFFRDVLGTFDPTYIGYIYWGSVNLKLGGLKREDILKYCTLAKPYFNFITYNPLVTEIVDLVKAPSNKHYVALDGTHTNVEYFYYPPINIWNNSSGNPLPSEPDIQLSNGDIPLGEYTTEDKVMKTKNMLPFEGDTIFEGRFGNSIRFGSSNPRGKNNWSENDSEGDPITIISNGQTPQGSAVIEDINGDASSIYLTSNQNINNLNIASKNFRSLNANFTEPTSGVEELTAFAQSNTSIEELINGPFQSETSNFQDQPNTINEGQVSQEADDDSAADSDEATPNPEGGYEDLVKIPGTYEDNSKTKRTLYLLPKRFSNGNVLVTDSLADPLMKLLLAAESDGTILTVNSGFRPPVDDIYLNGKLIQKSQKTVRLENLKSEFKGKIKEPWLERSTVVEPFDNYKIGDSYNVTPQGKHFSPKTAASYKSKHGASLACDFSTASATSEGYKWMCRHGWKYGFIRTVNTEPWHFGYKPEQAKNGPTAILNYRYEPGVAYKQTTNRWNNVFGAEEPNWDFELLAFQDQQAQELNA